MTPALPIRGFYCVFRLDLHLSIVRPHDALRDRGRRHHGSVPPHHGVRVHLQEPPRRWRRLWRVNEGSISQTSSFCHITVPTQLRNTVSGGFCPSKLPLKNESHAGLEPVNDDRTMGFGWTIPVRVSISPCCWFSGSETWNYWLQLNQAASTLIQIHLKSTFPKVSCPHWKHLLHETW